MAFGMVDSAVEMFEKIPEKNAISYNALMAGFCRNGYGLKALKLFIEMLQRCAELTDFSLTSAVDACGLVSEKKLSEQIHGFCVKFGCASNPCIQTALLDMCTRCERMTDAEEMFEQWPCNLNSSKATTSMLGGYFRNGLPEKALSLLISCYILQRNGDEALTLWLRMNKEGIKPDAITLALVISAYRYTESDKLSVGTGQPLVPALIIMGDSVVDAGNNNHRTTLIKANFPPYGRDFLTHNSTGRFSNGKLVIDFTAESLGFTSYPVAYHSHDANGTNLLTGANFASGASGFDDGTSLLYNAITLNQQLKNYKEYKTKVTNMVGRDKANEIFSGAIHLLSTGSSDFLQSYYINPILNRIFTPDRYSDRLMNFYSTFVQNLYNLGARRIGVTTLPPLGCLPAVITMFGGAGNNTCVERLNRDVVSFNTKLNNTSMYLANKLPGLKLVVLDIYNPLLSMVMNPVANEGLVVELEQWKLRSYAMQDRWVHARMLPAMCFGMVFIHLKQLIVCSQPNFLSKESLSFPKPKLNDSMKNIYSRPVSLN
ncbi:hypothetical protein Bca4012_047387 [Brassica carinata]